MGIIILLVVGGIVGGLGRRIMRPPAHQGLRLNLVGGTPITSGTISIPSILVSLLGAIILLAVINLVRRGSVR